MAGLSWVCVAMKTNPREERYFSPRDKNMEWNVEDQPPELWDQFNTDLAGGTHLRVHPLLHWTETNIWEYAERENIPTWPYTSPRTGNAIAASVAVPCTFMSTRTPIPTKRFARNCDDQTQRTQRPRPGQKAKTLSKSFAATGTCKR